jgi:hypothetical protein
MWIAKWPDMIYPPQVFRAKLNLSLTRGFKFEVQHPLLIIPESATTFNSSNIQAASR